LGLFRFFFLIIWNNLSPKSNFLKNRLPDRVQPEPAGNWDPDSVPIPVFQNKEPGYSGSGSRFWPKTRKPDWVNTPSLFCVFCKIFFFLLHCAFERIMYVRTCTQTAFDLAFVCSTVAPHHTHTSLHPCVRTYLRTFERMAHFTLMHPTRVRSNVPMYVRTYSVLGIA
jgi:hypothetical protein